MRQCLSGQVGDVEKQQFYHIGHMPVCSDYFGPGDTCGVCANGCPMT